MNLTKLRMNCIGCAEDRGISLKDFRKMFPDVSVSAVAKGRDLIVFLPKKCPACSSVSLEQTLTNAPRSLMREVAG